MNEAGRETRRLNTKARHKRTGGAPSGMRDIIKTDFNLAGMTMKQEPVGNLRYLPPQGVAVDLLDLKHGHCKWPDGDGPFVFCNALSDEESPYCKAHGVIGRGHDMSSTKELVRSLRKHL